MTSGGARNRSGPPKQETSGRSDRVGFKLTELPAGGHDGPTPPFPLPNPSDRELVVWEELWATPQAVAWAQPGEAWRTPTIGLYARVVVRCEDPDAKATLIAQRHRLADAIGLTPAGLVGNGWKITTDEVAAQRSTSKKRAAKKRAPRRRLRLAADGAD